MEAVVLTSAFRDNVDRVERSIVHLEEELNDIVSCGVECACGDSG